MKDTLKEFIPPLLLRKMSGLFYGWRGNYANWEAAQKRTIGYDSSEILNKVKNALIKVKNGEAVSERDSVIFDKIEYSFPVLAALIWIANNNKNNLNLIDFGGSLGSTYFQNKKFLSNIEQLHWSIVEQKHFIECGKQYFQDENLHFYESIDECLFHQKVDAILLSSVLQYIEKPYQLMDNILSKEFQYIIIDRTPFIFKEKERITIQKVHPNIYKASYPCWFFNENKFLNVFTKKYELITDFNALDRANIKSIFKGFIFKRKNND